ncbi:MULTISPECIES: tyrosine-type recombinase/integrase [unclassified Campylobacter]|uniref:tyrosine-type recombinase/integrase n=1 Tax=unclassified Campylobacter TaxID=2593542 RepID=UPI00147563F6|nr:MULTISPECIES: tyrosine-type recombinase/integrase [unclassified Campylobacter]
MKKFQEIDQWIEKQNNKKNIILRLPIPGYDRFKLEISPKQKKTIRLYRYENEKVRYMKIGEYPYMKFETAYRKGIEILNQLEETGYIIKQVITLQEAYKKFLVYAQDILKFKAGTLRSYQIRVSKHILPLEIALKPIDDIELNELKFDIFNEPEKYPAANVKLFYILQNIFLFAKKQGYIKENILENFNFSKHYETPSRRNSRHHQKIINQVDLENFLKSVANSKINIRKKILIFFALETALRSMNLFNLKWSDINFDDSHIYIPKNRMKGEKRTENSRQNFILPISKTMLKILKELKRLQKHEGIYIFSGIADQQINYFLTKISGITKHGLRGTFKTFAMKKQMEHRIPNYIIEMYLYHIPAMTDVEAAYLELRYDDHEIQDMLYALCNWWDQYLISLYDFSKII